MALEPLRGAVVNALAGRSAELIELRTSGRDKSRARFHGPSRALIGFNGEPLTRGTAIMHWIFYGYAPFTGLIAGRRNDVLVSSANGKAVAYAPWNLEPRGCCSSNLACPSIAA